MDLASLQERKELIDKVASDVAEQGPALEARLRADQGNNPLYGFLNPYCQPQDGNHYYRHKLQLEVMLEDYREQLLSRSGLQITISLSVFIWSPFCTECINNPRFVCKKLRDPCSWVRLR
jgi:hypothetical protein